MNHLERSSDLVLLLNQGEICQNHLDYIVKKCMSTHANEFSWYPDPHTYKYINEHLQEAVKPKQFELCSAASRSVCLPGCVLWVPELQAVVVLWPRAAGITESPAMAIHRALSNELLIWVYLQPDRCSQPQNLHCLPSVPWEWLRNKSCTAFNCWFFRLKLPKIHFLFELVCCLFFFSEIFCYNVL